MVILESCPGGAHSLGVTDLEIDLRQHKASTRLGRGGQSGKALRRRQHLSWALEEGNPSRKMPQLVRRPGGTDRHGSWLPPAPYEAAQTLTGCSFLLVLAVGLAGRAVPDEVADQGVTETRSRRICLPLVSLLRALPWRAPQSHIWRQRGLRPGPQCMVQNTNPCHCQAPPGKQAGHALLLRPGGAVSAFPAGQGPPSSWALCWAPGGQRVLMWGGGDRVW